MTTTYTYEVIDLGNGRWGVLEIDPHTGQGSIREYETKEEAQEAIDHE